MKYIGLTGNSGSGKSTAAAMLRELGAYVIDCDEIAHKIIEPGEPAYEELVGYFGNGILERGLINRKALAALAFDNSADLNRLTEITHKYILKETEDMKNAAITENAASCIVIDAPLLIEAGLHKETDSVWAVIAPEEHCIMRVMAREGVNRETVLKRLSHQLTPAQYAQYADVILLNDKDRESLYEQVRIKFAEII